MSDIVSEIESKKEGEQSEKTEQQDTQQQPSSQQQTVQPNAPKETIQSTEHHTTHSAAKHHDAHSASHHISHNTTQHQSHHHSSKKPIHKNWYFYLSIAILLILIIGGIIYVNIQNSKDAKGVILTVNAQPITQDDIAKELSILPPQYAAIMSKQQLEQTITQQLIFKKLLLQEAKKKNIQVTDSEVNKAIADFLATTALTQQQFEQKLAQQKTSISEVKALYKEQLLINKLLAQELFNKISITEEAMQQYYDENKDDLLQLRASHILICYNASLFCQQNRSEQEAKALAADLLQRITAGADFDELAKQYSDDPSAKLGGDLGWFGKGDMVLSFEEAAFALQPNQVSEIVQTQFGYHIIKLTARNESYADLKAGIEQQLSAKKEQTAVKQYLDALNKSADIKYVNIQNYATNSN